MGHSTQTHIYSGKKVKEEQKEKKINATILENTLSRHAEDKIPEQK